NVVWDCDLPHFDNGETGDNRNKWGKNVMASGEAEPAEARVLRETIAAKRKQEVDFQGAAPSPERPAYQIGYSAHRTDLPGGQFANFSTRRAFVVSGDGSGTRQLAPELTRKPNQHAQFAGWSPDGRRAILLQCWESAENGAWEHEHKDFRFTA